MKVARGRSWQPEIGMEHASRGRRSGNNGVGARWRGRFRIFSARHCSRTKVSHAENSGMTMLFFSWRLLRCRRGKNHVVPKLRLGMRPAKLRFALPLPQPSPEQTQPPPRRACLPIGIPGGFFHTLGAWERHRRHRGGGALLPLVPRAVAGACVGGGSGRPRMPPPERLREDVNIDVGGELR